MFSQQHCAEIELLASYKTPSTMEGIKVHSHQAGQAAIDAARRLHTKGLITQADGGYLTPLGCEALEHIQTLAGILGADESKLAEHATPA